jgi:long-chain acyl-CoA synthetase
MDKTWLKSYPEGMPPEIGPLEEDNLVQMFHTACEKYQDSVALESFGSTITYGQWQILATNFATYLQKDLGLKKGDTFAIMMPNCLSYLIVLFGALMAGMKVVNVNPLYTADELALQMNDSGAKTLCVVTNFAHTVEKASQKMQVGNIILTELGDFFPAVKRVIFNFVVKHVKKMVPSFNLPKAVYLRDAIASGSEGTFEPVKLTGDDIAFLQYTGGTTGVPKGAVLLHRNMMSNIAQVLLWVRGYLREGNEVIVTALPLYHIFSLTANGLTFLKLGGRNVLITNPRDIPAFVKTLKSVRFSAFSGVNTLFNALLHDPGFKDVDFSNLRLALAGGMATQEAVAKRWKETTGRVLLEAYGLTETSPAATINPMYLDAFNGSIGLPLPSTEISVRDSEGKEVASGEPGELWIRGPQVMQGYWNKPEETAKVLNQEGWLRTGDVVVVDDEGYVRIVDRLKDMVVVSGFNVYPNEVENVIANHPGVLEVGVIGVPNNKTGEEVKAFIVKRDDNLTTGDVLNHCREYLTAYKIPKQVEFIDELPKTPVGKVLRRELRPAG